jgi:hypothetical protein
MSFHRPHSLDRRTALALGCLLLAAFAPTAGAILPWKSTAPRLSVALDHPPLLELPDLRRIAIGEIKGECGVELGNRLTMSLVDSRKFEVLNRQNFDRIMKEHNFNWSGKVDTKTASTLGKALGAAVLVFGEITRCDMEQGFVVREQGGLHINARPERVQVQVARATLIASLQLVDLASAKIFTAAVYEGRSEKEFDKSMPDRNYVLSGAYEDVVGRFTRLLMPWSHTIDVALYEDGDARWDLKGAAWLIRMKKYTEAEAALRQTITRNESRPDAKMMQRALHDLGLALLFSDREREAVEMLQRAQALRATPEGQEALERARELQQVKEQIPKPRVASSAEPDPAAEGGLARCPHCKTSLAQRVNFCPACGKAIASAPTCRSCNQKLQVGARFCPHDGTPVAEAARAKAPAR